MDSERRSEIASAQHRGLKNSSERNSGGSNMHRQSDQNRLSEVLNEQSVSQMINTQQAVGGANNRNNQRLINTQNSRFNDNKSVKSLVSGISVSIRTGTALNNMAAKTDFQKVFQETITATTQKKINAKNAFEVDYFQNIDDFKKFISEQDPGKKWIKSGQVVDTGAKVYGYRVDNVHNETYRMWNGMLRNAALEDGAIAEEDEDDEVSQVDANGNPINEEELKKRQKRNYLYRAGKGGERTLETVRSITVDQFDTAHEKDPLFKKTTQKFDEMRIGNLMSSTLSTTSTLLLQLDSQQAYRTAIIDDERRKSNESATSSKNKKLNSAYVDIFRKTFDAEAIKQSIAKEQFLCEKYETLIDHVKQIAKDPTMDSSPMKQQASGLSQDPNNLFQQQNDQISDVIDNGIDPLDDIDDNNGGMDPYALNDDADNNIQMESEIQVDPERDAFVTQHDAKKTLYDLNYMTQMDGDQNSADIERFVNEDNFLQENESEIHKNDNSDALSQGFDNGLNDLANQFYGSGVGSKFLGGIGSQMGSHLPTNRQTMQGSRFSSNQASKTSFGMTNGSIGEGGFSIKNYIDSNRDLSSLPANALSAHLRMQESGLNSGLTSKISIVKGEKGGATAKGGNGATTNNQKVSKRKKDFEIAKDKILGHLDLTKTLEVGQKGKLLQNLENSRSAQLRIGPIRALATRNQKRQNENVPSLRELLKTKEKEVNPLTYNCDFSRLTQLFQRPLQIKYYAKKQPQQVAAKQEGGPQQSADPAAKFYTEDGDILEDMGMPEPDNHSQMVKDEAGQAQNEENFGALANQGEIEVGFEEPNLEAHGFGNYSAEQQQKNLRDMFKVQSMKRFDAGGGSNQEIQLNQFAIRKQVDVKRLKKHLWETMEPILDSQSLKKSSIDVEMNEEIHKSNDETRPETGSNGDQKALSAVSLLSEMYYKQRSLDPNNVSLQSSFICMLHLANEEGLQFGQENIFDNDARLQTQAESDFTIKKVPNKAARAAGRVA